jgi:hypothetical protein
MPPTVRGGPWNLASSENTRKLLKLQCRCTGVFSLPGVASMPDMWISFRQPQPPLPIVAFRNAAVIGSFRGSWFQPERRCHVAETRTPHIGLPSETGFFRKYAQVAETAMPLHWRIFIAGGGQHAGHVDFASRFAERAGVLDGLMEAAE